MKKAGVCARRVASQREMIEKTLAKEPMTIVDLAKRLGLSNDTIRKPDRRAGGRRAPGACGRLECAGDDDGAGMGPGAGTG